MTPVPRHFWVTLALACAAPAFFSATSCRAAVHFEFDLTYDPGLSGTSDYLSDLSIIYFVAEPGFPYLNVEAVSYFNGSYETIPIGSSSGFHYSLNDELTSNPIYAVNYATVGIYNDVDTGVGPSVFCTFSDPSFAVGKSYDEVFGDLNAVGGPYTEAQVLASLGDPLGFEDPDNHLVFSYFSSFILDSPSIASLFGTPIQVGQSGTLVHFSNGTAFGTSSGNATAVPEPATWVLAAAGLGVLALRRRVTR